MVAAKGNLPVPLPEKRVSSVIAIPRGTKHSEKPIKFYEIIEEMYPELEKIELFARKERKNWDHWGNEII